MADQEGMDAEANLRDATVLEGLDEIGMESRGPRAGVELDLDCRNA